MKLLSIKLLALAATTTTAIEEGVCEVDNSLHPRSRKSTMRSPSQVCEEESTATGSSYTTPYKCTGNGPLQYACCEAGLGDEMTTSLEGKTKTCTKEEDDMSEEEEVLKFVYIGSDSCEEDVSLNELNSHSIQAMNQVCQQNHSEDGYTVPYTCNGGTGGETTLYACCMPGVEMNVIWESDSSGLGLCTKVHEKKEEKEVLVA